MLKTQEFLRNGGTLEQLKERFAIGYRVNEALGVVSLNYNQIESPMSEEIVQECRCLILELDTWDVKGITFRKFFNHGEAHIPADFDWSSFQTYEKLDGSLIALWYHDAEDWQIATRSVPDGSAPVDDSGLTYRQLVLRTLEDMGVSWLQFISAMEPRYTYIYELMTPENQVVVQHLDRKLVLIGVRSNREPYYKESNLDGWERHHPDFPVPIVTLYEGFSKDAVMASVQERDPIEHEGYVLVDRNHNRVKVKSDAYCTMSHQRDGLGKSNRVRIELILSEKDDDILHTLPQFVQDKITDLKRKIRTLAHQITDTYAQILHIETQKDFASEALRHRYSSALFALRSHKFESAMDWLKSMSAKSVLEYINEEDESLP